jgi:uncharacterized protein YktA (UPF0223 family)
MNKQQADITREYAIERLNSYIQDTDEIYGDIEKLDSIENAGGKKVALNDIKEKYRSIKDNLTSDLKELQKYEAVGVDSRFYLPALRDMLHNSELLPINQVAFKNISKLHSSLYDIQDYANYWKHQLEGFEE